MWWPTERGETTGLFDLIKEGRESDHAVQGCVACVLGAGHICVFFPLPLPIKAALGAISQGSSDLLSDQCPFDPLHLKHLTSSRNHETEAQKGEMPGGIAGLGLLSVHWDNLVPWESLI